MPQEQDMPNMNVIGLDRTPFFPYAKSVGYAVLISSLFFSTTQLFANENSHGPGSGPHQGHEGYMKQNRHDFENYYGVKNLAYYGDWDSDRVFDCYR